jgi:catechol-2,3-dioxygenase
MLVYPVTAAAKTEGHMPLRELDHVTMHTVNLSEMSQFYEQILGLRLGERPAFARSSGAWLYCGERPMVHLIESPEPKNAPSPGIEHFAFRAEGLANFLAKLRAETVAYDCRIIPGREIRQVHLHDTDGNHIEVAFAPHEEADLTNYDGK